MAIMPEMTKFKSNMEETIKLRKFKLCGPSPMTVAELAYNNQSIRKHIDAVAQFCKVAANTPEAAGKPNNKNFYEKLYKDLLDFKNHVFFELDNYDEI